MEVPSQILHSGHRNHALTLVSMRPPCTVYCNACTHPLTGFHYHCTVEGCYFNLHPYCASVPLALSLPSLHQHPHPHHSFSLLFSPPYENKLFTCKLCKSHGECWLYQCNTCSNFEVHIGCAIHAQKLLRQQYMPMPTSHQRFGGFAHGSQMPLANLGTAVTTACIHAAVEQLLGIGFGDFLLQDDASSLLDDFIQLIHSLPGYFTM